MLDNLTVVIADDEEHVRETIATILEYLGLKILAKAKDGKEAIAYFNEYKPDLLLLDINMPFKSGIDVLKEISGQNMQTTIIMLTAVSDMESIKKCITYGANIFIRKDNPMPKIMEAVKELVDKIKK